MYTQLHVYRCTKMVVVQCIYMYVLKCPPTKRTRSSDIFSNIFVRFSHVVFAYHLQVFWGVPWPCHAGGDSLLPAGAPANPHKHCPICTRGVYDMCCIVCSTCAAFYAHVVRLLCLPSSVLVEPLGMCVYINLSYDTTYTGQWIVWQAQHKF